MLRPAPIWNAPVPTRIAADTEPIPGYRLIERLGRGGFGEVWKVLAPGGIYKAIKFVYGNLDEATDGGKPAQQELKALNRVKTIRHPYILSLERYDIVDGQLIIVMELADRNLFDRFRECQNQGLCGIPRDELLSYMEETAEALDLMNSQFQLQHLDIKPQNLFLVFNHVKVADFGLAKDLEGMQATLTGGVTPVYAAPETFECRVTRFCDQYSLAIVYQELLTAQRPYNGSTARHLMMQHIQSAPDLSALPEHDRPVIARALAKKPEERFPTCAALVQMLQNAGRVSVAAAVPEVVGAAAASSESLLEAKPNNILSPLRTVSRTTDRANASFAGSRAGLAGVQTRNGSSNLPSLTAGRPTSSAILANARPEPPERVGDGVLLPALVIGLGQFGLTILQRLRRTLRDRYGSAALPSLRLLYVDTEGETLQSLNATTPTLDQSEVYVARLNRPSHYNRSRDDLPDVASWLNPQLLFRIPRQPATSGIRAFGRLAFCDHYRAIMSKVRTELEAAVTTDSLESTAAKTGLELRTNRPRVYIVTSLMGGTGSGIFLDLAYAVRLQLRMLGYKQPEVHGLLFAPPVDANAPKSLAVANSCAALTELFHFSSPSTTYEGTFDSREGTIIDRDPPFRRCMLLQLPESTQPSTLRPIVGLGAGFLYHEMFTTIGRAADKARMDAAKPAGPSAILQTSGAFRLTWPRRILIERAGRRLCERLLASWTARGGDHLVEPVRVWLEEQWVSRQLTLDLVRPRLLQSCPGPGGADWTAAIQAILDRYAAACNTHGMESADLCAAMEQMGDLLGLPDLEGRARNLGQLGNALDQSARTMSAEAEQALVEMSHELIELPGSRLLGAEEFVRQLNIKAQAEMKGHEQQLNGLNQEAHELYVKYVSLASNIETMSRGNRRAAASRDVMAILEHFSRKRVEFLQSRALIQFYRAMVSAVPEHQRDVQSCRKRLEGILQRLIERRPSADRHGYLGPNRALLPPGCNSLDEAAAQLAESLGPEELLELDAGFQIRLCQRHKGLLSCCLEKSDSNRPLTDALYDQSQEYLKPRMVKTNAATIFFHRQNESQNAQMEIVESFEQAAPPLTIKHPNAQDEICLLAVPKEEDGERFLALGRDILKYIPLATVTGFEDIIFYREQQNVSPADVPQIGPAAREAFNHISDADQAAPYTRTDVRWQAVNRDEQPP
jgi:eukaryotic-like serine/threonine-protein kinase